MDKIGITKRFVILMVAVMSTSQLTRPTTDTTAAPASASLVASAGPGVLLSVERLSKAPQASQVFEQVVPFHSDIDPATLRTLKAGRTVLPPSALTRHTVDSSTGAPKPSGGPLQPPTSFFSFAGPDQTDNTAAGFLSRPPDPDTAIGPRHVVVGVNQQVTIYSRLGKKLAQMTLATWFSSVCSACSMFDPRIAYDPQEGHWIITALHQTSTPAVSQVLLSVSQTSNAMGSWWVWSLDGTFTFTDNTWADYEDVGFDGILSTASTSGAIYITTNQFSFATGAFRTSTLYILPKSALYSGGASTYWRVSNWPNADSSQAATLRAAKTYGTPTAEFLINSRNSGNYVTLWNVLPTYPPTPVNATRQATIMTGSYSIPPHAPQSGCANLLDTGDNRMYNAVWRNDRIYAAFAQASGSGLEAIFHYLKINTTTNTAEIDATFGAPGVYYFYPAITVDNANNIFLTFARSATTEFAGVRYTGHRAGSPSAEASTELRAGTQCITGQRWGDYFGAAADPLDFSDVAVFGQWASNLSLPFGDPLVWNWSTQVGRLQFIQTFGDVLPADWGYPWIEELYRYRVTGGCAVSPLQFCPDSNVTRAQMAVFIIAGLGVTPCPSGCPQDFADVPPSYWAFNWIEEIYRRGITAGCAVSPLRYCPDNNVTRAQMAVFMIAALGVTPCPSGCPQDFSDVPPSYWAFNWIEEIYRRGITAGCAVSPLRYCPDNNITRREMSVFLIRAFFP